MLVLFTPLQMYSLGYKAAVVLMTMNMTMVLPTVTIWLMMKFGIVKGGFALRDRADRKWPLIFMFMYCLLLVSMMRLIHLPVWALLFYVGAVVLMAIVGLVSQFWKISGHASGNAALTTAAFMLYGFFPLVVPFVLPIALLALTGLVSSIRLYLDRHTPAQVYWGAFVGCISMILGNYFV